MTAIIGWEQEKDVGIFKLAKIKERKNKDVDYINHQKVLVKDNNIKERWRRYFSKL